MSNFSGLSFVKNKLQKKIVNQVQSLSKTLSMAAFSLSSITGIANAEALQFEKGARQFCVADLSAEQQSSIFARMMNIGASYGHGCLGCEANPIWLGYTEMTEDQFWVRRNFLAYFYQTASWKNPEEFAFDKFYILENDAKTRPNGLFRNGFNEENDYTGEWVLNTKTGAFGHLSPSFKDELVSLDPSLPLEGIKVGGPGQERGKLKPRETENHGVLLRTIANNENPNHTPKSIYDLGIDGGFLDVMFGVYANKDVVDQLNDTGWTDENLRKQAIESLAAHHASLDPSVVIGVDTLFWDTVFEGLHYLRESGPQSPMVRLVLGVLAKTPLGSEIFDQTRRENVRADYLAALGKVSNGYEGREPVPVLLARLAEDPITKFKEKDYMPVLATVFGQFFEQVTGINFIDDLLFWLEKIQFSQLNSQSVIASAQGNGGINLLDNGSMSLPALGLSFSKQEVELLVKELNALKEQMAKDLGLPVATPFSGEHSANFFAKQPKFAFDPLGGSEVTLFPKFTKGIVRFLVDKVLIELPVFIEGLENAFANVNEDVVAFGNQTDNNVHILDVDEFYENLGYFLNPRTAHPSVLGAKRMAGMIERTLCGETLIQSNEGDLK